MNDNESLKVVSDIILTELESLDSRLRVKEPSSAYLATPNDDGINNLVQRRTTVYQEYRHLLSEPFIGYVRANVHGQESIYFICRSYTPPPSIKPSRANANFASYKSPIGRIIEQSISHEIKLPNGRAVAVLEKDVFKPIKTLAWDAVNNQIYLQNGKPFSIKSFRDFLLSYQQQTTTISEKELTTVQLEQLEEELRRQFEKSQIVKSTMQKAIIGKIALRDQPILDDKQGEIFRLPLSSQIILTGAPGTGKTTTLIKRVAQKSDSFFLDDAEKIGLNEEQEQQYFSKQNWYFFTPNLLLKIYLKEALAKEDLPGSDSTVKVWDDTRKPLGRDLGVLRISDQGVFTPTTNAKLLMVKTNKELIDYANLFIGYYLERIRTQIADAYDVLLAYGRNQELVSGFRDVKDSMSKLKVDEESVLSAIQRLHELRQQYLQIDASVKDSSRNIVNNLIAHDDHVLDEVINILAQLEREKPSLTEDINDILAPLLDKEETSEETDDVEDAAEEPVTADPRLIAKRQINRTIGWYAERIAENEIESAARQTKHRMVLAAIKQVLPSGAVLADLGAKIIVRKATNQLTRGFVNILERIPHYYQRFRLDLLKQEQSAIALKKRYADDIKNKRISSDEIDILIFILLRNARLIFKKNPALLKDGSNNNILETVKYNHYRTQIAVDEATDFTSVQLGCMYHLAHPNFNSVMISGDLMQRVTTLGLNNWDECGFIGKFELWKINTVYRQNPKLLSIAQQLYKNIIGDDPPFVSAFVDNTSDPEPLKYKYSNDIELGRWIAARILEIYKINKKLPSIAIFVSAEEQIDKIYDIMREPLESQSIEAEACSGGKFLSEGSKVRIFSINYIKGLEFEGVFFVNIDDFSLREPDLVDKYLYVGLTRAASFLGVIYKNAFPEKVSFIENHFHNNNWKHLIV